MAGLPLMSEQKHGGAMACCSTPFDGMHVPPNLIEGLLEPFDRLLDRAGRRRVEAALRARGLRRLAENSGSPDGLRSYAAIGRLSRRHANGFEKIVLFKRAPLPSLRLHVWRGEFQQRAERNIHDHTWDFVSHVLCGCIANQTFVYDPGEVGDYYLHHRWRRRRTDGPDMIKAAVVSSRARVAPAGPPQMLGRGQFYRQAFSELHATRPVGCDFAATLVWRGADRAQYSRMFSQVPRDVRESQPLAAEEVIESLLDLRAALRREDGRGGKPEMNR